MDKEKIVVVSANNNPDYLFFMPYIEKAWNSYGWKVCFMVTDDVDVKPENFIFHTEKNMIVQLPEVEGLRKQSIAQAGRLYAANYLPKDALIMTSDIDLIPLQDYWKPSLDNVTIYGHDLTWRTFYPMGYCAMAGHNWIKYMGLTGDTKADMLRDAKQYPITVSEDWNDWWNWDWRMLTDRLKPHADKLTFIDRGQIDIANNTLAVGRIDRWNIQETLKQETFIDMHCHNTSCKEPARLAEFISIFERFHGAL